MTEPILDPATERGIITRMTARSLVRNHQTLMMRAAHADPVAEAIARGVLIPPPTPADYRGDAHANPTERLDLVQYGRVMAERERLRRLAE